MNAADVMTAKVVTVTPATALEDAARLMLQHRISGLPVVDEGGAVVGMVTEGDLLHRGETGTERHRPRLWALLTGPGRLARDYVLAYGRKVGEVMTNGVVSVTPQTPLDAIAQLMESQSIKRLPVIDQGRLVGIVSRANLVAALLERLSEGKREQPSDEEITRRLLSEIDKQPWAPRASIRVAVEGGIVELDGTVLDERERQALRVMAENMPGVKGVRDRLVWVDAVTGTIVSEEP